MGENPRPGPTLRRGALTAFGEPTARFVDRWTVRFDVVVAAASADVWRAVTYGPILNEWFMPRCSVEPGLEGKVSFTFGDPDGKPFAGSVTRWEPHVAVEYTFDIGVRLRFELTPVPGGTHVVIVFAFADGTEADPIEDDPGGDVPGGPGTPWQPGFLAGLHLCAEALGPHLAGTGLSATEAIEAVNAFNAGLRPAAWHELLPHYRELIVRTLPKA